MLHLPIVPEDTVVTAAILHLTVVSELLTKLTVSPNFGKKFSLRQP